MIIILRQAHLACQDARSRGQPPDPQVIADLRTRYDQAVSFGITHNRHRDWHDGNHPGYALGSWLHGCAPQVWLFTIDSAVEWTNNVSEQGAKAAKRHQAVSGYWHPGHPRPLVPDSQLPRLRHRPRAHRPGLRQCRPSRQTLAPAAPRPATCLQHETYRWQTPLNGHLLPLQAHFAIDPEGKGRSRGSTVAGTSELERRGKGLPICSIGVPIPRMCFV